MGCSRGVPGLFGAVPGCSVGVPGVFRGVPGVIRGVPGCSGCVPGFTDTPISQCTEMYRRNYKFEIFWVGTGA